METMADHHFILYEVLYVHLLPRLHSEEVLP